MTTIRTIAAVSLLLVLSSCTSWKEAKAKRAERESYANPFYMKYLESDSALDREIMARIEALRANPESPVTHNALGALLFERRFSNDARYEFKRALEFDKRFYPARYNLALVEIAEGNTGRAERILKKLLRHKPGHPEAHFTLGLLYEQRGRNDAAIDHYAEAFTINPDLLQVRLNPRIVESKLVTASLLTIYDASRARASARFMDAPGGYIEPAVPVTETTPEPVVPAELQTPAQPAPSTPPPGR
ncbi:MAG: tetratricopeptide repeat protein [Thermoanaerobaculia bacterium]|nr:tetratricopeptide repeat protein [Thermoanaerobaculia bacterium]